MKRFWVCILALLLALSSFACLAETVDWTTPYEEPVDIHIAVVEATNAVFLEGEDYFDNMWWKLFREKYNVNVIVDWVASSEQYPTKLNLCIASNTLPDAFWCNAVQLNQLMDAGLLEPLNEVYESTASEGLKKMMEDNWDIVEVGIRDDNIYAMPRLHYGYECETSMMWTRKDWSEAAGLTGFESLDDIKALMDTFKQNNGASYGVVLEKTLDSFFRSAPLFNALPKIWYEGEDGTLVYGSTQPAMKDALAWWADLYANGYIRNDFGTLDQPAANEDFYNGKVGIAFWANWAGWQVGQDMVNNQGDDTYFTAYDYPKSISGEYVQYPVPFNNTAFNVVRKGYEHPEVLIKLLDAYNYVLNESVATGGMTLEEVLPFNTDEMHHITGPFKLEFASYTDCKDVGHALETGEKNFHSGYGYIYYEEARTWKEDGALTGLGRYLQMGPNGGMQFGCDAVDRDQIAKCAVWGAKPQTMLDYGSTLDDILLEGFTMIIMGNESVDYFDTLVENWKMAGGDAVTEAVNEMYGGR